MRQLPELSRAAARRVGFKITPVRWESPMDRYEFTPMDGTDLPPTLRSLDEAPASRPLTPVQAAYLHTLIQSIRPDEFGLRKQTR